MLSPALFRFIADLRDNNEREWFNANKKRYESEVLEPTLDFIRALEPELKEISPRFEAIAKRQGGSMFRIYRDVRFSKDKSPYKDHVGMNFRHEMASRDVHAPGFYLHLAPGNVMLGGGMWQPDSKSLGRIRNQIVSEADGWTGVRKALAEAGLELHGTDALKRAPKGFDADHEHIEDLKRKSFAAMTSLDETDVVGDEAVERVAEAFAQTAPLIRFLCESQDLPFD
ncbi:MAG: TIGR02453 family protein [Myxococcota bacterium]